MRILHVITSLLTGGAEKLMVDLLPLMKEQGHDVELCLFLNTRTPFMEELEAKGLKMYAFHGEGNVYNLLNIVRLWKLMRKGKYDIVHTHNTASQLFVAIASVFCKTTLVTTEHNTDNRRRKIPILKWGDKWMYSQYCKVICISDQAEINLRKYLGLPKEKESKIMTIYNGINYELYANSTPAKDVIQLKNDGERRLVITNVAAFRPQKDQPTLIKAMKYLPEEYHLCLVGGGDDERKVMFERMIAELGLGDRVHLLGLRRDVNNILAASDYVVMCSHYEGLSLSSIEGMASGKPFLASDVDGLHEIVDGNGVLFTHEDAKELADAILQLESDEEYRKQIAKQCQAKAKQYDISIMAENYLAVYETLLNS